ncbi:MAG: hypothetical protein JNM29_22690 [Candidatus Odyssella sp.]|nr:hypothetical protein [Candidatus Odyssella sp.]
MREKLTAKAKAAPRARATDSRAPLAAFLGEVLVVCPRCAGPAVSKRRDPAARDTLAPRRLVCRRCGHLQESRPPSVSGLARTGHDDYFRLPLWLATPCCGELLWAFNARHLAALEAYALADLRERRRDPAQGWSNQSLASRLPKWVKAAKNRAEVGRALARLGARLAEAG